MISIVSVRNKLSEQHLDYSCMSSDPLLLKTCRACIEKGER